MKIVVYTCTFLDYDEIYTPVVMTPGVDYVLFSDRKPRFVRGWRWLPIPEPAAGSSQTMANRYCKFFPHKLFPDADVTIYADGKTLMLGDLRPLIDEFLATGAEIGLFSHKRRTSLDDEVEACKRSGKIKPSDHAIADAQIASYYAEGLPRDCRLTENGVILRRHDGPKLEEAMDLWWREMATHTQRDQLSGPYVLYKTGIEYFVWSWNYARNNPYFLRYPHKKRTTLLFNIEMYAFVQKNRKGAIGWLFRNVHRAMRRVRGDRKAVRAAE